MLHTRLTKIVQSWLFKFIKAELIRAILREILRYLWSIF